MNCMQICGCLDDSYSRQSKHIKLKNINLLIEDRRSEKGLVKKRNQIAVLDYGPRLTQLNASEPSATPRYQRANSYGPTLHPKPQSTQELRPKSKPRMLNPDINGSQIEYLRDNQNRSSLQLSARSRPSQFQKSNPFSDRTCSPILPSPIPQQNQNALKHSVNKFNIYNAPTTTSNHNSYLKIGSESKGSLLWVKRQNEQNDLSRGNLIIRETVRETMRESDKVQRQYYMESEKVARQRMLLEKQRQTLLKLNEINNQLMGHRAMYSR